MLRLRTDTHAEARLDRLLDLADPALAPEGLAAWLEEQWDRMDAAVRQLGGGDALEAPGAIGPG